MHRPRGSTHSPVAAVAFGVSLFVSACAAGDSEAASDASVSSTAGGTATAESELDFAASAVNCEDTAALFIMRGSANPDHEDPEVAATCDGDSMVITTNAVPDYTYIGTSPGVPGGREFTFTIPPEPTLADAVTDVPYIGTAAVTLSGIPIYGPTKGTGGDVDSLPGSSPLAGPTTGQPDSTHTRSSPAQRRIASSPLRRS